jgi:hypothetical protein
MPVAIAAEKRVSVSKSGGKTKSVAKHSASKSAAKSSSLKGAVRTKSGRLVLTSPAKSKTSRESWSRAFAKKA